MSLFVSVWTMRMLVRLVLGLFVLKAVVASPRFSRQVDMDTYDGANYDVNLNSLNLETQDMYDYEDGLTIDDPQVRTVLISFSQNAFYSTVLTDYSGNLCVDLTAAATVFIVCTWLFGHL